MFQFGPGKEGGFSSSPIPLLFCSIEQFLGAALVRREKWIDKNNRIRARIAQAKTGLANPP